MGEAFSKVASYLNYLRDEYNVQICIKDFCGFIPINKELDRALQPFLAHTNPFCMYMKTDQFHYRVCLSMIRPMRLKCDKTQQVYFGMCHAGLGEYIIPIFSDEILLGALNVGFFQNDENRTVKRIARTCATKPPLSVERAICLYHDNIASPTIDIRLLLPGLEMLAEYLGQTYKLFQQTHNAPLSGRYHNSSEDTILSHALEYIRSNITNSITITELADFCHCSESYISRIFKKRTGVNINLYINKMRIEAAKNHLLLSHESMADIAAAVGFNDPNYFYRIFSQIIGISPTEFRRRFHQDI